MKKNVFWNVVAACVLALLLLGIGVTVAAVIRLDMLPNAYLIALIGVFALFFALIAVLFFVPGKGSGKVRKIIACLIAVILLCGCAVITTVAMDVIRTLEATNQEVPTTATREIYVLSADPAQSLEDASGYTFGYVTNYDNACTQQVLAFIAQKQGAPAVTAAYDDVFAMVSALQNHQINAMILNAGYMSLLEDVAEFQGISEQTRILERVPVAEPEHVTEPTVPVTEPEPTEEITEATVPVTTESAVKTIEPFMVYVSGSDSHSKVLENGRSDVNILAAVNPMTKQVLLVNTPRDYYVANTAGDGALDKLTHCGVYGIKCSMNTLGNLYKEPVEYYVRINFTGFKTLIDAMGGVTVYSDYAFTAIQRTEIKEGINELNGQQALDFARERYTLEGGDNERGKHQMQVIQAVIEKATTGTTIISNYSDIIASLEGMFSMNVPAELISDLMKMQLSDMASWNVVSYSATGQNASAECYSMPGTKLSVIKPNQSSVSKATRLIDMVFAGEILTEEAVENA